MPTDRRIFLKTAGGLTALAPLLAPSPRYGASTSPSLECPTLGKDREPLGWKAHTIQQGDGRGGWVARPAEYQFLVHPNVGRNLIPYGLAQMDNGEFILVAAWNDGKTQKIESLHPVVAFSRDAGKSWTGFKTVTETPCRPVIPTYLGKGNLTFETDLITPPRQYFSSDYGRSWEAKPLQLTSSGDPFNTEGNALVERDTQGVARRIAEAGYCYPKGTKWPKDPAVGMVRWSGDGGRTWGNETRPKEWRWQEEYQGKTYTRGVSEGSLVRAANGWLIAALRTDMPARYFDVPNDDSLEGTGVSISKDDGVTWSPVQILYDAGRHHAHLLRLPNGDILMTLIVRVDVQEGRLASYRRGLEAILSHDNGLSWDVAHKYVLDDYEFYDGVKWYNGECGHLCSALLDDGFILSCYLKYLAAGASLIRWKPGSARSRNNAGGLDPCLFSVLAFSS